MNLIQVECRGRMSCAWSLSRAGVGDPSKKWGNSSSTYSSSTLDDDPGKA